MKNRVILATLSFWIAAPWATAAADSTEPVSGSLPSSGTSFESFRIIFERNIFNPNRSGRSPRVEYTRREPERRVLAESIALLGTLSYEKGRFAFFDGSNPDYRKVLQASETIAGYTIASVTPEKVVLQSTNEGEIQLPVGMQMTRHDQGKWEVGERPPDSNSSYGSSSPIGGGSASGSGTSSGAGGSEDEILRRMMQRREQEDGGGGSRETSQPESPAPPPTPGASNASTTSSSEDEIVRRMLEKREQELRK